MASYAAKAGKVAESIHERVVEFRIRMDPSRSSNPRYVSEKAKELSEKISTKIGRAKIENLTYHREGRWIAVLRTSQDANALSQAHLEISECEREVTFRRREDFGFLITIKCDPVTSDEELVGKLSPYVEEFISVKRATYEFDRTIEDGRRLFRVKLSKPVNELPHQIELNGQRIMLHFAGKEFFCRLCGGMHIPREKCKQAPVPSGIPNVPSAPTPATKPAVIADTMSTEPRGAVVDNVYKKNEKKVIEKKEKNNKKNTFVVLDED